MKKLLVMLLVTLSPSLVCAHGGVSIEEDKCIMKISNMTAHFTGYQPEVRATQQFCEDIPELGRAIIVIDYISPELRQMSVEVRVLKDVKNREAAGRYQDLGTQQEIDAATVVKMPPTIYPRGTITFDHQFDQPGWYIGMLTATDPKTGVSQHSVFPFKVGVPQYGRYVIAFLFSFGLAGLAYFLTSRKYRASGKQASGGNS